MITRPTDRTLFQPLAEFEKALHDFSRKNKYAFELYLQTPELQQIRPDPKRATDRLKTEKTFLEKYRRFYEPLQAEVDLFFRNLAISRQNGHNEWVDFNATMMVIWDRATRRLFYQFKRNGRFPEQMSAALSLGKATVVIHNFTRTGVLGVNFNAYPMLERQDKCQSRVYLEMAEEEEFKKMYRISENELMFAGFPETERRRVLLEQNEKMRQKYENESLYYMLCKSWSGHVKNWESRFRRPFPGTSLLTVHRTTTSSNGNGIPLITLDDNEQSTVTQGMTSSTDSSEGSTVDVEMTSSRETSEDVMEVEDVVAGEGNQTPSESASDDHDDSSENLFNEFFIPNSEDVASPRPLEDVTMIRNPLNVVSEFPTTSDSQPDEDLFGEFFQMNSEDVTASESPTMSGIGQEDVRGDFRRISIDEDRIQGGQDSEDVKPSESPRQNLTSSELPRHQNPEISEDVKSESSPEVKLEDVRNSESLKDDVQRAPESPLFQNREFLEDVKEGAPEDVVKIENPEYLEESRLQDLPTTSESLEVPRLQDSYPDVIIQRPEDVPVLSEVPRHKNHPESSEDVEIQKAKSPEDVRDKAPESPEDVEMESPELPQHQNPKLSGDVEIQNSKSPESPRHLCPNPSENVQRPEDVPMKALESSVDVRIDSPEVVQANASGSPRHQDPKFSEDVEMESPEVDKEKSPESSEVVQGKAPESPRHLNRESADDVEIQKAESSESSCHLNSESPEDVQRPAASPEDVEIQKAKSAEDVKIESSEFVQEQSPESPRHLSPNPSEVVQRPEDVAPESPRRQNPPEDVKIRESESPESEEGDPFHLNLLGTPRTSQDISEPSSRLLVNPAPDVDVPEDSESSK
ncbi:hypothetical protein L3Y34_002606 [Caenorhabditis briggsae]|uniref:Uncharacterized protein n=2 Tax=Caenorhabditis briggsae TaxID=6238 RepID=A0AAE9DF72_CAEBR|nr:hypothetical protein L3Y34_002606 [Caenorhabditis briggsae]